jgi:Peptidase family M28
MINITAMSIDLTPATYFAQRALSHAQILARNPRPSATDAEKQAAEYAQVQLGSLEIEDVRLQPFLGLRSIWLFLALAFGLALVGHAAFWMLRHPLGDLPAVLISLFFLGLSGYLLWRKFTFRDYPLRTSLPHGPSQNVIAVLPPAGEVRQRLVLVSHLDSHRAVFWFANDILVKLFALSSVVTIYGVYLAGMLYVLAVLTHWQVFGWLGLVLALFHFLGWFTGVTADLGMYSPGANDNAASIGTLLALAERLMGQPLQHTQVWLAFTGCEETGCDGMLALLKEYGDTLKEALFLDFEQVGIGDQLIYLHDEGGVRRRNIPPDVERLVQEVGQTFGIRRTSTLASGAFTEGGTLWEHGYKAVCLLAKRQGSPLMPEWHRLTDIPSRLQVESLGRIHDLAWQILQKVDSQAG